MNNENMSENKMNTFKEKWMDIKKEVKNTWNKITDDDLERVKGNYNTLADVVKQKYDNNKQDFDQKISTILERFDSSSSRTGKTPSRDEENH